MKDWTGNHKSTFSTLGASNHSNHERETHDYYATEPRAIDREIPDKSIDLVLTDPPYIKVCRFPCRNKIRIKVAPSALTPCRHEAGSHPTPLPNNNGLMSITINRLTYPANSRVKWHDKIASKSRDNMMMIC